MRNYLRHLRSFRSGFAQHSIPTRINTKLIVRNLSSTKLPCQLNDTERGLILLIKLNVNHIENFSNWSLHLHIPLNMRFKSHHSKKWWQLWPLLLISVLVVLSLSLTKGFKTGSSLVWMSMFKFDWLENFTYSKIKKNKDSQNRSQKKMIFILINYYQLLSDTNVLLRKYIES